PTASASCCGKAPARPGSWPASPTTRSCRSCRSDARVAKSPPPRPGISRRKRRSYNGWMRLLLQQRPGGPEAPRFVQLMLERDLLGAWTLVRESGKVGGRSTVRREQYLDQGEALA